MIIDHAGGSFSNLHLNFAVLGCLSLSAINSGTTAISFRVLIFMKLYQTIFAAKFKIILKHYSKI